MTSFFQALSPGQWVDLACAVFAIIVLIIGVFRGVSGHLAHMLGLAGSAIASFWLFRPVRGFVHGLDCFKESQAAATVFSYVAIVLLAILLFLLLRAILKRVLQLVVKQPFDALIGALVGAIHAFVVMALAFASLSLLPDCAFRRTFCESSRVGRWYMPIVTRFVPAAAAKADKARQDKAKKDKQPQKASPKR